MKVENGNVYLEVGDKVEDSLTCAKLTIIDIFVRDGQKMVELTDNHGSCTTTLPKYLRLPANRKVNYPRS